ncbi:MAG: aminoglycoside phosphotransferase family protein [Chloroflexi bacterium]|nr:aminoglycoside phosphotransferase family protein [Chloroflexota bacterium]MCI0649673.1 aminoglycoside phosphotransferase family protein [Chloroflexota bacterium]MCI0731221.1 aminoglycoside phosphotransferase family protein [Chloroflexota bacterium]
MLEKPHLKDEAIMACLRHSYGLAVSGIEFLPVGNDSSAGVYRVNADDGKVYFLKVRQGPVYEPGVAVPRYLQDQGVEQVVAPLPTTTQELWERVEQFALILYPFIEGKVGMEVGLTNGQWIEYGAVVKTIHTTQLPSELLGRVQKESFVPNLKWSGVVRQLSETIRYQTYDKPVEKELAAFWREKQAEIDQIVDWAEALGRALQRRALEFVLCHADIHTANLLLTPEGKLFVVDWDQAILAPKERDLMFVVGNTVGDSVIETGEEELFFRGYGKTDVDWLVLAYYRYEWVVQEMGDYGERVFLMDVGTETKQDAVQEFLALFEPGNVVEAAHKLDHVLFHDEEG